MESGKNTAAKHIRNSGMSGTLIGPTWLMGWLFTLGYAKLVWWQAAIALVIWPYYLGAALR